MPRCFDCLQEFAPDEDRFAVLKKMRDIPPWLTPAKRRKRPHASRLRPATAEKALLWDSLCYAQVFICADCAGWYGDEPVCVSAEEAGH